MTGIELPRKITALVTPFKVNEQINYEAFRENVAFQIANGWTPLVFRNNWRSSYNERRRI